VFLSATGTFHSAAHAHELLDWAQSKTEQLEALGGTARSTHDLFNQPYLLPRPQAPLPAPDERFLTRNQETVRLYHQLIGRRSRDNFIWTGIESGNPLTRDESYRWDSLEDQGLFDPVKRKALLESLQRLGIRNIRMGMSNHRVEIDKQESWREHDELMSALAEGGLNISLDLHHFGIEDRFRVSDDEGHTVGQSSYYLHPDWPDHFARFAAEAFRRYGSRIKAITLINEPETTVGFNSEMWHGAFPRWSSPLNGFFYVERAIQVAKAAVKARLAIEEEMQRSGHKVFFMHPEAAVYKPSWSDFNRFNRFFASDLILGKDWLLNLDIDELSTRPMSSIASSWQGKPSAERSELDWLIQTYVIQSQPEDSWKHNRQRLVKLLRELQALHQSLHDRYGVSMRSNTVFGVDYYAHNEDRDYKGAPLRPLPELYDEQVRDGRRAGLYRVIVDYFNRYQMPIMIGETGTPYYHYGMRWHQQMLLECADAMEKGVPFVGYTMYPAVDTWGWETALSVPKEQTLLNPGGLLDLKAKPKPFVEQLLQSLSQHQLAAFPQPDLASTAEPDAYEDEAPASQKEPAPL
jgi:beta-glucosidase/6-phospho-beta-glucosidase/beta-galactosidase